MTTPSRPDEEFVVSASTMRFPDGRRMLVKPGAPAVAKAAVSPAEPPPPIVEEAEPATEEPVEEFDPLLKFRASEQEISLPRIADLVPEHMRSSEFYSVNLPSGFFFYPFKTLSVRPLRGSTQAKFTRAAKEQSLRHAIDAVSSCLGNGVNAATLHIQDFYYVMYWLRLASYTKFDFTHVSVCRDRQHLMAVQSKSKEPHTLKNISILRHTNLQEAFFDPKPLLEMDLSALKASKIRVGPPTLGDAADLADTDDSVLEDAGLPLPGDELNMLLDLASVLDHEEHGNLISRLKIVNDLPGDALQELEDVVETISNFGVKEFINVHCKECGAEQRDEIAISAHTFLRSSS